ncbi:MAG TPA: cupredoxin domain-containing protein [Allosphingosinicella sp.]|jgi:plastocyanin
MGILVFAALILAGSDAAHQGAPAEPVVVRLSSFDFAPATLRLRAGVPVLLRLENRGGGGHNFSAPQFFAAARVDAASAALVLRGAVEVPSNSVREIRLVPAAGRYRLRCTHSLHTAFGMKGWILVE